MFDQVGSFEWLYWYQVVLFVVLLLVGFLGGSLLLWVGVKHLAKGKKAEFVPCVVTWLLVCLVGVVISIVPFVGWIGAILLGWLIIARRHDVSFGKGALAWLPTLPVGFVCVALMVAILMPSLAMARELAKRQACAVNLRQIGLAVNVYAMEYRRELPADLHLVDPYLGQKNISCPAAPAGEAAYFYFCPKRLYIDRLPCSITVIACDLDRNHNGFHNVLFLDGHVVPCKDVQFRELLGKPENKDFAEAFAAAEQSLPSIQRR